MSCFVSLPSHGAVLSCLLTSGPTALFFQVLRWEARTHPCSLSPPAGSWLTVSDSSAYSSPPWFLCPSAIHCGPYMRSARESPSSHLLLVSIRPLAALTVATNSPDQTHPYRLLHSPHSAILSPGFLLTGVVGDLLPLH